MNALPAAEASRRPNPWPYGIVAAFVVFVGGLVTLVVTAQRQGKSELISADYYDREIKFQSTLDAENRALAFRDELRAEFNAASRVITVTIPKHHATGTSLEGSIQFYRPSSSSGDHRLPLQVGADGSQSIDARAFAEGPWEVRVEWKIGGDGYSYARRVVITPGASTTASR